MINLLGWMHRKFRQNSGDVFKDYGGGGTCNCLSGRPSLDEDLHGRRRQYEPFGARSLRLGMEELTDGGRGGGGDPAIEELLGGLLTIGTLGMGSGTIEEKAGEEEEENAVASAEDDKPLAVAVEELVVTPATLEAIAEKEEEATTETDLMVVGTELEKVLAAEAEKGDGRMSSARSSYAGSAAWPLQGFLFGSPIEVAETMATGARKERRASLGELFMMSRIVEEGRGGGKVEEGKLAGDVSDDGERKPTAEICVMKKKMTKRRGGMGSDGGSPSNVSTVEKKFQKILQIFHRKVHPESSLTAKKASKTVKFEKNDYVSLAGGIDPTGTGGRRMTTVKGACRKESIPNPPSYALGGSDSNSGREHWIKTDADYLVLEL
ncbi:hypothetical protein MUK42_23655 [Musa troglodytarum]|uniref:Protein LAZY 1 n=1 Tax=Musa troglodytarum TaxID=320322 RepID=A0A9E7GFM2_9LILI|nr:hypothetical protein MUK42_23655 [Musa troglodytarum]